MAWHTADTAIIRVRCHAPEPANSTRSASANGRCNYVIGDVPGPLVWRGTLARLPEKPDGRVWIQCCRCRSWNLFDAVSDE